MPFLSPRFGRFCNFRPKVCFSTSRSKRFEILAFSSGLLTPSIFSPLSQGLIRLVTYFASFFFLNTCTLCFFFFFERQIWITDGLLEYHRATSRTTRSYPSPLDNNAYTPIQEECL
ncbi:hypothetical protein Hanom_Chr05g00470101 [Helianthus anomalus]